MAIDGLHMGVTNYLLTEMILQVPHQNEHILFPAGTFEFFMFLLPFGGISLRLLGGYLIFSGVKQGPKRGKSTTYDK